MEQLDKYFAPLYEEALFVFGRSLGAALIQLIVVVWFELKAARVMVEGHRNEVLIVSKGRLWAAVLIVNTFNVIALQVALRLKPQPLGFKYVLYYPLSYLLLYWITFVVADIVVSLIGNKPFIADLRPDPGFWGFNKEYVRRTATIILLWFLIPLTYIAGSDLARGPKGWALLAYVPLFFFIFGRVFILH
jgi:hypothetical protein